MQDNVGHDLIRATTFISEAQREALGSALADALAYRERQAYVKCPDCDASPSSLCEDHAADFDRIERYTALARELGIEARA